MKLKASYQPGAECKETDDTAKVKMMSHQPVSSCLRRRRFVKTLALGCAPSVLAVAVIPATLGGGNLFAQTNARFTSTVEQQRALAKAAQARSDAAAEVISAQSQSAPGAVAAPSRVSPASIAPADQPSSRATVSWDGRELAIQAFNSSLDQILHEVANATGAKVEGFLQVRQDERIFGSYGPGSGCDVLSKLLDGSGYNVLMIGSRSADAPLRIVLSARLPAGPQTLARHQNHASTNDRAAQQVQPDPPPPDPSEAPKAQQDLSPFANGGPQRDSMEFMQEILERQQKIDQQQQQQQDQQKNLQP